VDMVVKVGVLLHEPTGGLARRLTVAII